ncbi:MAG: acetylglutamate kinase [Elusimicrobia bacterium]|nr:acetylglutamate kinase [Elusimicrobiota bacterium]
MKNIVVIKYGGSLLDDKNAEKIILKNIINYAKNNSVIVVHGGGKEISNALGKANIEVKFINGLRYTGKKAINIVENVLENIQYRIAKKLNNAVAIKKVVIGKRIKELGHVGRFVSAKIPEIQKVLSDKKIAVISPVGKTITGQILNLNADEVAGGVASNIKAQKLLFFTDVKGVLDNNKKTIPVIKVLEIKKLIAKKIITGGMIPKIQGCAKAVKNGVREVDIYNINLKGTKIL